MDHLRKFALPHMASASGSSRKSGERGKTQAWFRSKCQLESPPRLPDRYHQSCGIVSLGLDDVFGGKHGKEIPMPHGSVTEIIPARSLAVFCLLHDYDQRIEWDTLLESANLCDGWSAAELHATSICTGRWYLGGIALKTEYVSFDPPNVAAVKMLNRPPFFDTFAATIRHRDLTDDSSSIEYIYNFTARPAWLRWLLHPVMSAVFRWETKKRLAALRRFFSKGAGVGLNAVSDTSEQSGQPEPPVSKP